ncbi:MAG: FAD/FMN-containing dehydrogenase [Bradymonadia bacterium]
MIDHLLETNPEILAQYVEDEAAFEGKADAVIRTGDIAVIAEVMRAASASKTPVWFSARRTSLTGAALPNGGWVIGLPEDSSPDLVEVDVAAKTARVPARVLMSDIETAAERAGLFFPPDPTSRKTCSIGGSVACNASGARSFGFGSTGDWVVGLTVCLADGTVLALTRGENPPIDGHFEFAGRRVPLPGTHPTNLKTAQGYAVDPQQPDLIDLFVGSEGTLGYIHDVTVRLLEGAEVFAALVFWDDERPALTFVESLQNGLDGVSPMSVEWFDRPALELAAARHPRFKVPKSAQCGLFIEQRHAAGEEDDVAMAWYEALLAGGAPDDDRALRIARTKTDIDAFREFRHAVPESINALARSRGLSKLGTDLSYPKGWLLRMVAFYDAAVHNLPATIGPEGVAEYEAQWGPMPETLDSATFGHIGDNHLHLNLLPKTPAEMAAGKRLYRALALHCAAAGGSISAEHGVGKFKAPLLAEITPKAVLDRMRAIKKVFDPAGILAPGNVFSLE